jgi:hypothetical protein
MAMAGFSVIAGNFPLTNPRHLMSDTKPQVRTYDAEIFIKRNAGGAVCSKALVNFFIPVEREEPFDDGIYFVAGCIWMIDKETPLGEDYEEDDFLFQIDAFIVRVVFSLYTALLTRSMFVSSILSKGDCRQQQLL